MSAKSDINQF